VQHFHRPYRPPRVELEKNKAPHNVSTSNETFKLRAELKELKEVVFIDATGTNACGDVPVGLTQEFWDTGNRRVISWDTIHKLAAEQGGTSVEYNGTKRVVNAVVEREEVVEKEGEVEEAKFLKVKGRGRKTAKETATTTSGAMLSGKLGATSSGKLDRRPVCPVMLAGDRCHGCAGYKHPPGCEDPTHGPRWSRPASCRLWHYGEGAKYRRGPISSSGGNPPPLTVQGPQQRGPHPQEREAEGTRCQDGVVKPPEEQQGQVLIRD
jgi:hypothetical protein